MRRPRRRAIEPNHRQAGALEDVAAALPCRLHLARGQAGRIVGPNRERLG